MPEPTEWPGGAPPGAVWNDDWGRWTTSGRPPAPWPVEPPGGFRHDLFGPPGTWWFMSESQWTGAAAEHADDVLRWVLKKLRPFRSPQGAGGYIWEVPDPLAPAAEGVDRPMRYMRVAIIGKIGQDESVCHTLGLRTAPVVDVDQDVAAVQTLANQVRDIWTTWFNSVLGNSQGAVKNVFPNTLTYTEVRAAYVNIPGPGQRIVTPIPGHKDKITYSYPKAEYLVRTQYANFANGIVGGGGQALPYEVAHVMSLESGRRGAANRGRMYLGPLSNAMLGNEGNFDTAKVAALTTSFGAGVIAAINAQTGCDVHVVSRYWNDSIPVIGVRAGIVPDSQRRRRRSRPETYGPRTATPLVPA